MVWIKVKRRSKERRNKKLSMSRKWLRQAVSNGLVYFNALGNVFERHCKTFWSIRLKYFKVISRLLHHLTSEHSGCKKGQDSCSKKQTLAHYRAKNGCQLQVGLKVAILTIPVI